MTVRIRIPQMVSRTVCSDYPGAIQSLNSRLATSLLWNVKSNKAKSFLGLEAQPSDSRALPWLCMAPTAPRVNFLGQRTATAIPLPGGMSSGRAAIKGRSFRCRQAVLEDMGQFFNVFCSAWRLTACSPLTGLRAGWFGIRVAS